jgi:folate-binding protein YgfZ
VTDPFDAAREGAGLARLGERGILAVSGPDRKKFLHSMLSNDVAGREVGRGCLAALMDVKGRILALMRVLVAKDAVFLEMPTERLKRVESTLAHYRVAAPVRFAPQPASVLGLLGPRAGDVLAAVGVEVPAGAEAHAVSQIGGAEVRVARASDLPAKGFVLHADADQVDEVARTLASAGAVPLDGPTLDVLRVEEGMPWYGPDVSEENLLHETGLVTLYHSPTKGCYVGQEVVARLEGRGGNVSKRLRGLRLEAPALAGAAVSADGADVGRVTTAGVSPRFGPVAMAYLHRSHAAAGSAVAVGGSGATVVELPFGDRA